jgi:hypothetical protein
MYDNTTTDTYVVSGGLTGTTTSIIEQIHIGDNLFFTASPFTGYYFQGLYATRYVLDGVSSSPNIQFVVGDNVNVSTIFSTSSANYTVRLSVSPAPVSTNAYSYVLQQGINYTFTVFVTSDFHSNIFGQYNLSITGQSYNAAIVQDIGVSWLNNWAVTTNQVMPPYSPGGSYITTLLNQDYNNGNFNFILTTIGAHVGTVYQGMAITVYSTEDGNAFNTPLITIKWLLPSDVPTLAPTATAPNQAIDSFGFLGFLWGTQARELYSIIILAALSFLFLWKGGVWGLFVGLAIGEIVDILFLGFPSWTLYPLVGAEIVIVATALLGERGGASK